MIGIGNSESKKSQIFYYLIVNVLERQGFLGEGLGYQDL